MPHGLRLDAARSERARRMFDLLKLPDVTGTPTFGEVGGEWFKEIVGAVFGTWNGVTRAVNEFFVMVSKKNSKALALDTMVATPAGFTTMGRLAIGDCVLDADGIPTTVTEKSPVFIGRRCFEVEFSTGERVVCDAEHLWVTDAHIDRGRSRSDRKVAYPSVKTTEEIARTLYVKSGSFTITNHRTRLCSSLDLPAVSLPIPPYVLGAWLGDGHAACARITSSREDAEHLIQQITACGHSAAIKGFDSRSNAARISIGEPGDRSAHLPYRFRSAAIKLRVLGNKHIPGQYLRSSRAQRLDLLRGLMDTDGSISIKGQASYTTTSPALRDGVLELINSLGFKASFSEHRAILNGTDHGPVWNVQFWPFDDVPVFTIPRKLARQRTSVARNAARSRTRQIVAVRDIASVPTQCISVASQTRQYLVTRSFVPTHNTTNAAGIMVTAMMASERPRAEFLLIAPTQQVAELAFSQALGMIEADPVLRKMCQIKDYQKFIRFRPTGASLKIKSFDPAVLTGSKPAGVLLDELHVIAEHANADRVLGQLRGGLISSPEAFLITITTQSERVPVGVFRTELQKARKVRDGEVKLKLLPILYEFPVSMVQDDSWRDSKNWWMVNPNKDRSVTIPRLVEDYENARSTGEEELRRWASQHLNIEIGLALHTDHWVGARFWQKGAVPMDLGTLLERSETVTVGIDGGGLDDMLALTVCGRDKDTQRWVGWTRAWIHEIAMERRKKDAQIYKDFARDGDLIIVKNIGDDVTDLGDVVEQIVDSGKLAKVGIDQSGIGSIIDELVSRGVRGPDDKDCQIVGIPQGWRLTAAIKTVERKLADGTLTQAMQPLTRWCAENARVEPRGNAIIITKQASGYAKIDPLMSTFNAIELMSRNPAPQKKYAMFFVGGE
jgi:phage terminase large subunit-like protein